MKTRDLILSAVATFGFAATASATPSTTVWAPSTTYVQGYMVPHLTYDTYFSLPSVGAGGDGTYPVDVGLTMGVLPFEKLNLEIGFDALLASEDPFLFNAKLGVPEDAVFGGSPSIAVGIFGVGTARSESHAARTDYDILYGQIQKNLPWGGFLSVGAYYGAGDISLWKSASGEEARVGFMGGIAAPDIVIDASWLRKIVLSADIQTGNNIYGAAGVAATFYFTDTIGVLTGPVFFFERELQPGHQNFMWTVQLDVDMPLKAAAPAPAPAVTAPPTAQAAARSLR